jgi:hypothetical protein
MIKDLRGKISVRLNESKDLEELCAKHIPGYDRDRFEIVAIRVFASKEFIVTVYAADKVSNKTVRELRYPVKKFKIQSLAMHELYEFVEAFNFTISADDYDVDDMDVTNK